jgi:effector-binding domain-containing protein
MAVEQASYKVIIKESNFEVRFYDPLVVAVSTENEIKGYSGFNNLFNYISGQNKESKKIAMTAPVLNNLDGEQLTTTFVMPRQYSVEVLPQPNNSELQFKEIPERFMATITFSGNINQEIIDKKKQELIKWLQEKDITTIGPAELARYNPPFIPGFIKRNEVLIEVNYPTE